MSFLPLIEQVTQFLSYGLTTSIEFRRGTRLKSITKRRVGLLLPSVADSYRE